MTPGRWASVVVGCAVGTLVAPRAALAEEGELQVTLSPLVAAVHRYDAWRLGEGLGLGARVGVPSVDWLSVEVSVRADQLRSLQRQLGPRSWQFYSMRRVGTTMGVVARYGHYKRRLCAGLGVGYRGEHRHGGTSVGPSTSEREDERKHRIVAALYAAFEWRWSDRLSAALWASGDVPAGWNGLDAAIGISGSLHLWR